MSSSEDLQLVISQHERVEAELRREKRELEAQLQQRTAELEAVDRSLGAALAEQRLARYTRRVEAMYELEREILAAKDLESIARSSVERLGESVPFRRADVLVFDEATRSATFLATRGDRQLGPPPGLQVPLPEPWEAARIDMLERQVRSTADPIQPGRVPGSVGPMLAAFGLRSFISVPLVAEEKLLGILHLGSPAPNAFDEEHVATARALGDILAVAIQQAGLREELRGHTADLEQRIAERTAQLQESVAELDAFSYSVAHNLRAPLRALQGFAQILLEEHSDGLDEVARGYLLRIARAPEHMDELIRGLLAYARLVRLELPVAPLPLGEAVVASFDLVRQRRALPVERVELDSETLRVAVLGHLATLAQAIAELVDNALKFGVDRPGHIRIRAERRAGRVRLWVEDEGSGIAPEYHERIFELFEQLQPSELLGGTGAGLAIARKAVERMGGSIGVESTLGQGSRFWIELAGVEPAETRPPHADLPRAELAGTAESPRNAS